MQLLVIKLLMSNPNMISSILYIIHIFPMQIPEAIDLSKLNLHFPRLISTESSIVFLCVKSLPGLTLIMTMPQ